MSEITLHLNTLYTIAIVAFGLGGAVCGLIVGAWYHWKYSDAIAERKWLDRGLREKT